MFPERTLPVGVDSVDVLLVRVLLAIGCTSWLWIDAAVSSRSDAERNSPERSECTSGLAAIKASAW